MIKIIIAFFFFLILFTFLIWLQMAKFQEKSITKWISENFDEDYNVTYSLNTLGYPNRLDTNIKDMKLISKMSPNFIHLEEIKFVSIIYNQNKHLLSLKLPIKFKIDENFFTINEGKIKASFTKTENLDLNKFTFHGEKLNFKINKNIFFSIENFIFAIKKDNSDFIQKEKNVYVKLDKPILIDVNKKFLKDYNFKFPSEKLKNIILEEDFILYDFFKKNLLYATGRIQIDDTNIIFNRNSSNIPKFMERLLVFKE